MPSTSTQAKPSGAPTLSHPSSLPGIPDSLDFRRVTTAFHATNGEVESSPEPSMLRPAQDQTANFGASSRVRISAVRQQSWTMIGRALFVVCIGSVACGSGSSANDIVRPADAAGSADTATDGQSTDGQSDVADDRPVSDAPSDRLSDGGDDGSTSTRCVLGQSKVGACTL